MNKIDKEEISISV